MALQKLTRTINFGKGLDTKTDPWQVMVGNFLALQNTIFTQGGLLQKRNGFQQLPSVSNNPSFISTYAGNLVAIGTNLQVLSQDTGQWLNRGTIQPVDVEVTPAVRSSVQIIQCDAAVAPNGLACCVYTDSNSNSYYQIVDSSTGQILVSQTTMSGALSPRVFSVGNYFIITFLATVSASPHLRKISIPIGNPSNPIAVSDVSTSVKSITTGYDGISSGGNLYLAWNGSDGGGAIRLTFIDSQLNQHNTLVVTGKTSNLMSLAVDSSGSSPLLWATFWDSSDSDGYSASFSVSNQLQAVLAPTLIINTITVTEITSSATGGLLTVFYETSNTYPSPLSSVKSDFISSITCTTAGTVGSPTIILRGVGIAGKAFYLSSTKTTYLLATYGGSLQPSYFLIDSLGNVISKIAYENGTGYISGQVLANANVSGNSVTYGYLFQFIAVPVNPAQGVSTPAGIYGQAGVNLGSFAINASNTLSREIAGALHLTGGFLWMYDGNKPVEHGFQVFPEDIGITTATGSGSLIAQQYYYYAVYAWTDAQGNTHRSAPSIPYGIVTTTSSSRNTLHVPTLRQTYKIAPNSVRIEIYRWSTAQQIPFLITSQTSPLLNDPTVDSITYVDSAADSAILGNEILYTFGGTVEDIPAPACSGSTLFKSRLFLIDAEDRNLLWFSKVVIEDVPVEFSDVLTLYVAPTISSQGSTGPMTALSAMDDKLIIFKKDAIYYITGDGPDNTGANSDYGDPVFITSTVGCNNPQSIVLTPQGLMFQSDKGIWLLGRDLSTTYIGAAVEQYNSASVLSAITVPGTNQVRFTLSSGTTLMDDYYYGQWGTFSGIPAVASTVYNQLHTFLNSFGQVFQENPGSYLDGSSSVLMSFTTSWLNLAGLQGYQRAYEFYLLGKYLSPHKLQIQIAYDYAPGVAQQVLIQPDNYNKPYGGDSPFGSGPVYGGNSQVEQWRIFLTRQKCQAFQLTVSEIYDPSFGVPAGAGLTLSGLNLVYGVNKGYPRLPVYRQAG